MNNLYYPLRVSKNKPLPFFEKINDRTENIENGLVFFIEARKAFTMFTIKQIPRSVFEIRHIRIRCVYFLFRLNSDFGFFRKP